VKQLKHPHDLLIDGQTWQAINDPTTADDLARALFSLKIAIDSGPGGAQEASAALLANIESAYLHTEAHRAALKLYLLSLTGQLQPADEPLQLLTAAIKRGLTRIELTQQSRARKKQRR
jgi:hypothetical protein